MLQRLLPMVMALSLGLLIGLITPTRLSAVAASLTAASDPSLFSQGVQALEQGQYEQAIATFSQILLEATPAAASSYANRCLAHLYLNHYPEAVADCSQAIEIGSAGAEPYLNRGLAYYRQGDFEAALADYTVFLQDQPEDSRGFYNRGLVELAQRQLTEALQDFDRAIAIGQTLHFETASPRSLAQFYNDRGLAHLLKQLPAAAVEDFDDAIALNPTDTRAYFNRGCACHQLGQEQEALSNFDRVLALDPSHSRTYLERGLVRYRLGDRSGAIADLETAAYHAHRQGALGLHHAVMNLLDSLRTPVVQVG